MGSKVKLEIRLTIVNRQPDLLHALICIDQQMPVVDGLRLMRSRGGDSKQENQFRKLPGV